MVWMQQAAQEEPVPQKKILAAAAQVPGVCMRVLGVASDAGYL
ncbi:MAG: hypothetical protein OIF50_00695 [Flavobacteriaceae bacterium]|nr:hypothetical protein [Flavobacteriaceae bacterium]